MYDCLPKYMLYSFVKGIASFIFDQKIILLISPAVQNANQPQTTLCSENCDWFFLVYMPQVDVFRTTFHEIRGKRSHRYISCARRQSIVETNSLIYFYSVIGLLSMCCPPLNRQPGFMERSLKIG